MTCDVDGINSAIKSMVGRSRRVCQVGERIIDNHDDPLYRNGLLVYIKALHKGKQKYKNILVICGFVVKIEIKYVALQS
jgi:hypothetical protein